ncbi:uncharacterized protein LOC123539059 [Mercenaria mercenaria]|uniref:uncharacterized protein LOC123539059 n=1 Tax=Mercenaria mercenaria TaxID=6596 RepID=UPI00234F82B7|nr:uncharacterized protein LOC123539059 [Mercenaria mercenaria]
MNVEVVVFVLLTQLIGVAWGGYDYSHCTNYAEYNTLANLMKNDTCMQADSVFKQLTAINIQDGGHGGCRIHLINLLADHVGRHASTPVNCHCQGWNRLQEYHTGPVDGITNLKDHCLAYSGEYRDMYNQFFKSQYSNNHYMACRTHHSVWSALRSITTSPYGHSSCQKDIIFRLKYAFEHLTDDCICKDIYSHCTNYAEYNTLANLMKNDTCMQADSVFKLLTTMTLKEGSGECRIHIINLLADHFGRHASTPNSCHCQGANKLQQYHLGSADGITTLKDNCLINSAEYKDMYNQYFVSPDSNNHHMACRTHHSVWSALRSITTNGIGNNSCQKDIIFHLKYAFEHFTDHCLCTDAHTHVNGHQGHDNDKCHHYDSFNKLQQLAETDGCLSANSVWHYLDDLQVNAPECRRRIQKHLNDKYATSQDASHCTCNERRNLINHEIHRMDNGSFFDCRYRTSGTYSDIEADLFSNILAKGCQNHDYLWPKLEGVHNHCSWHNRHNYCGEWIDCTRDLIVRAAIQYPTDDSDSCVCSKITSSTLPATLTSSTKAPTSAMTSPSSTPTTATKAPTSAATTPTPTPTTPPPASATSVKVTQSSTSGMSPQRTTPTIKFACNKLAVVEDIARSLKATHPDSSYCNPSAGGSDDAYVLSTCNLASPMTWKKGANVMADCESSTQLIPTYTPISTFDGDSYTPLGAQSGIFLGCDNNGIKIAIQKCNGLPEIVHIGNGAFIDNSRNYYVVV